MNCNEFQNRIDEAERREIFGEDAERHREMCAPCRVWQSERAKLYDLTSSISAVEAPKDFEIALRKRLRERENEGAGKGFRFTPQLAFSIFSIAIFVGALFALVPIYLRQNAFSSQTEMAFSTANGNAPQAAPSFGFDSANVSESAQNAENSATSESFTSARPTQTVPLRSPNANMIFAATPRVNVPVRSTPLRENDAAHISREVNKDKQATNFADGDDEIFVRDSAQGAAKPPQLPTGFQIPNGTESEKQNAFSWLNFFGINVDTQWIVKKNAAGLESGDRIISINGVAPDKFVSDRIEGFSVEVLRRGQKISIRIR